MLSPSSGLGGGIERYVETLQWAFADQGVACQRVDLLGSGSAAQVRLAIRALKVLRAGHGQARLVVAHPSLLPAAALLARQRRVCGISVICHGTDVWGSKLRARWYLQGRLMRRADVRVVAVSGFTGGALCTVAGATVLPPGLSSPWFQQLVDAQCAPVQREEVQVVTAFRLGDWRGKGLPQLLEAVTAIERPAVRLVVCGNGEPPQELVAQVRRHPLCTLRVDLTDAELANQLAAADIFVLATRTKAGRNPSGEGFGLALLEAQVAGTAVVAPAHGGSRDAYLDGVTGIAPVDESSEALTKTLSDLLGDPERIAEMSNRAAEWAQECFAPERYARLAVTKLL